MSGNLLAQTKGRALTHSSVMVPQPQTIVVDPEDIIPTQRRTTLFALLIALAGFGSFLIWGFTARLDAGAEASGTIVSISSHTPISNYEGGTIQALLVKEGDLVKAGQIIVKLDPAVARAQLGQYRSQYVVALAQLDRSVAEQQNKRILEFSQELLAFKDDPMARDAMREHQNQFDARWLDYDAQIAVNRSHIEEANADMAAYLGMEQGAREHLKHTDRTLDAYQQLKQQGLARIYDLYTLQSAQADLHGAIVQYQQTADKDRKTIQTYETMIVQQYHDRQASIAQDLAIVRATLSQLPDQIRSAENILERKTIRAPSAGRVVSQKYSTIGGVVQPGAPILDIVPAEDDLVAEVQVNSIDIDALRPGLPVEIQLLAYKQNTVPRFDGTVMVVGADKLIDPTTGLSYYIVRVRLSPSQLAKWHKLAGVDLYPGMPVEALIVKGERRAIDYFIEPFTDTFWQAFREK